MAFEKYGGHVWQSEANTPQEEYSRRGLGLATFVAASGAAAYAATTTLKDGSRPLDHLYQAVKLAGNMSPLSIGNTFRLPEWLSPFTSSQSQGLKDGVMRWDKSVLGNAETLHYIEKITGLSKEQLSKAGLTPGMAGGDAAEYLEFRRDPKTHRGSLVSFAKDQEHVLSDSIALMQSTPEEQILLSKSTNINRAAQGVVSATGARSNNWFDINRLFSGQDGGSKFIPIPSITGRLDSLADLNLRTSFLRGVPAFGMERLNTLLEGVSAQVPFLGDLNQNLDKIIGSNLTIRSGTATEMMFRYGGKAAAIGGLYMGVQQLDWARRNLSIPGHVAASGVVAGAVGGALTRLGYSSKTAFIASAASFFGQLVLPGFDQGVVEGVATMGTKAMVARAAVSPFNWYRRTVEGYLPGVSNYQTGALVGLAAVGASMAPLPFSGKTGSQLILDRFNRSTFGIKDSVTTKTGSVRPFVPNTVRQEFWGRVDKEARIHLSADQLSSIDGMKSPLWMKRARLGKLLTENAAFGASHADGPLGRMNYLFQQAEEHVKSVQKDNPMNHSLLERLGEINSKYSGSDVWSKVGRRVAAAQATVAHAFFGADPLEKEFFEAASKIGFTPRVGRAGAVFGAAFLAHGLLTGGLLGSMDTASELRATYSGKKLVEVRNSRFWEAGGTPFEGDKISYFRPHQYHLMMTRAREKGNWGAEEDRISPVGKFLRKNFTYQWERQHYNDRPYPVTGAAFQDIPVIGGVLSATIGKLIKPARLMHVGEWVREGAGGGFETADVYEGYRREPAYALGGMGSGLPEAPLSPLRVLGGMSYQFRELEGMTGWAKNLASNALLGEDTYFDDKAVLASANWATSMNRSFWETQQGGGMFMNEALRRFLPRPPGEGKSINPIANTMPSWLPDKFKYGDPYTSIEWGEARLPGDGYAALHPELKGLDPEAYPLIYKYSILADVGMHSEEFRRVRSGIYRKRAEGKTSESENQYIDYIDGMVRKKMDQYSLNNVHANAILLPGSGMTQGALAGAKQFLRDIAAPAEYMIPMGFRPIQKLMGDRDAIDQYEYERMYGTKLAFWDKPWRDWFRPSLYSAAHMMGFEGKPVWRKEADQTSEYFDKLEFVKWMRISDQAARAGDSRTKIQAQYMAASTRSGVNPMGSPLSIYWTLPAEERAFFNAFSNAQGSERDRILEMVPSDQAHLYKAIWSRADAGDPALFPDQAAPPNAEMLSAQYQRVMQELGGELPPNDWIGWNQDVDMSDIKVRYVEQMGRDIHDFGMWESESKKSHNQPFLDGSTEGLSHGALGRGDMASLMYRTSRGFVSVHGGRSGNSKLVWNDDRGYDLGVALEDYLE